jgi:hypothetical protein
MMARESRSFKKSDSNVRFLPNGTAPPSTHSLSTRLSASLPRELMSRRMAMAMARGRPRGALRHNGGGRLKDDQRGFCLTGIFTAWRTPKPRQCLLRTRAAGSGERSNKVLILTQVKEPTSQVFIVEPLAIPDCEGD